MSHQSLLLLISSTLGFIVSGFYSVRGFNFSSIFSQQLWILDGSLWSDSFSVIVIRPAFESLSVKFSFLLASFSPFASSSEDTAEEILAQIGCGKFIITGGNWDLVSEAAKVKMNFLGVAC